MARLILEEGGERRAFRFDHGKLTIGAGEGCTLTLKSPDVAEIHCDLEIGAGEATLRARAGVQAPVVNGSSAPGETVIRTSAVIAIGEATLRVDLDESDAPVAAPQAAPQAAPAAPQPAPAAPRAKPKQSDKAKRLATAKPAPRSSAPRVQRTKRTVSRGMPGWAIGLILVAVAVVAVFVGRGMKLGSVTNDDPENCIKSASEEFNEALYLKAAESLDRIDERELSRMSDELRKRYDDLRERLKEKEVDSNDRASFAEGTTFKDTQLDRFRTNRLHGSNPPREKVRVYLKRVREFKERWPSHPDMEEVLRYEVLFKKICDLSLPATFRDIEYEVETMTWAAPRDYKGAFEVVEKHLIDNPGDASQCNGLLATMRQDREEYFNDRALQARYEWDRNKKGAAVGILIGLVTKIGDQDMAQEAAENLVKLRGIEEWLRGYKDAYPDKFATLAEHPTVSAKVQSLGL